MTERSRNILGTPWYCPFNRRWLSRQWGRANGHGSVLCGFSAAGGPASGGEPTRGGYLRCRFNHVIRRLPDKWHINCWAMTAPTIQTPLAEGACPLRTDRLLTTGQKWSSKLEVCATPRSQEPVFRRASHITPVGHYWLTPSSQDQLELLANILGSKPFPCLSIK